ncbi:hypothetical protein KQH65_06940 [archaeon]|nr:hypothetical protein [archaeon]
MRSETTKRNDSKRNQAIMYLLGFSILVYFALISSDNLFQGICLLLCYIPLFLFARYLRRYGGMGWSWPN